MRDVAVLFITQERLRAEIFYRHGKNFQGTKRLSGLRRQISPSGRGFKFTQGINKLQGSGLLVWSLVSFGHSLCKVLQLIERVLFQVK